MSYGRIIYSDQRVVLNNQELLGIYEHSFDSSYNWKPVYMAGHGLYSQELEGVPSRSFSFSSYIDLNNDFVTGLFNKKVTGKFLYKKTNESAYNIRQLNDSLINSYSMSFEVGKIPEITVGLEGIAVENTYDNQSFYTINTGEMSIIRPYDLQFSIDGITNTERVQSIKYTIPINYKNRRNIGEFFQSPQIEVNDPIISTLEINLEVDSYDFPEMQGDVVLKDYFCSANEIDIDFYLVKCGETGRRFSMDNARLINMDHSASIGNNMNVKLTYGAIITGIEDIGRLLST